MSETRTSLGLSLKEASGDNCNSVDSGSIPGVASRLSRLISFSARTTRATQNPVLFAISGRFS
jgi:hypothetical protein